MVTYNAEPHDNSSESQYHSDSGDLGMNTRDDTHGAPQGPNPQGNPPVQYVLTLEQLNALLAGRQPPPRQRPRLPDVEKYDGEDTSQYPQFEGLLRAKLAVDGEAIGGEGEQIWYGFSRLKDKAASRIYPWVETYQNDAAKFTKENFFKHLRIAFKDPAAQKKALLRLNSLQQGSRPFIELLQEVDQLLLEAGGHSWDDDVKKGYLITAMNPALRDRLATVEEADSYEEYCQQVKRITDKLTDNKYYRSVNTTPGHTTPNARPAPYRQQASTATSTPVAPVNDPMDWEPSTARSGRPTGAKRAKWVTEEEIQRRRQNGNCLRCGAPGHRIAQCPFLPARRPSHPPAAKVAVVDVTGAVLEDDEGSTTSVPKQSETKKE